MIHQHVDFYCQHYPISIAEVENVLAGYVTVRWGSEYGRFRLSNAPIVHHLEVLPDFRRHLIASCLLEDAERWIAMRNKKAGIMVGIDEAYGSDHR
jgi:GNAT superfamily N-acetyltransferase